VKGEEILVNVPVKEGGVPKTQKYYKLSPAEEIQLDNILEYLLHYEIIAESEHNFGQPVFVIQRAGSDQRMGRLLIDSRKYNERVKQDVSCESVDVYDITQEVLSSKYVSIFDAANGYFHLKYDEETIASGITQIYTRKQAYYFRKLIMGGSYSPRIFCRTLKEQLNLDDAGAYSKLNMHIFFDDIIVCSRSHEDHMKQLELFFSRLARLGLKLNMQKSRCFVNLHTDSVDILGFTIEKGKLQPQAKKLKTILEFPPPKNIRDVQKFLGYLNFLRNMLNAHIFHFAADLYELTSSTKEFEWSEKHQNAFNEINYLLKNEVHYVEPNNTGILILYCDASDKLYSSLLLNYDLYGMGELASREIDNSLFSEMSEKKNFIEHIEHYKLPVKYYDDSTDMKEAHIRILTLIYFAIEGFKRDTIVPKPDILINNIFNTIFSNLKRLESVFGQGDTKSFLDIVLNKKLNEQIFFEHFTEIMCIISVMCKSNVKMIFGNTRVCKQPFLHFSEDYNTDILLGYDCLEQKIYLLYIAEDFTLGRFRLTANTKYDLRQAPPDLILDRFKKELASENPRQAVRLVGQFTKACPMSNTHSAIYIKEAHSILLGLEHFSNYIRASCLTLVLTDSKVCVHLCNNMYANKLRRVYNIGVKINLSFPNVKVIFISGKTNHSDYLSRLGFPKEEFFSKTLTPIRINPEILNSKQGQILTFSDIYRFCRENPDLIEFSDEKFGKNMAGNPYLEESLSSPQGSPNYNFVQIKKFNIFNELLSRKNLIIHQTSQFGIAKFDLNNGVYTHLGRPVLPLSLFAVVLRREHLLNLHPGVRALIENVCKIYYVVNLSNLKELANLITKNCIGCILNTIQKDIYSYGYFPLKSKGYLISLDWIVGFPSKYKHILNIIDVYTRFCTPYAFKSRSSHNVITALGNYLAVHGAVRYLLTDNEFRGRELKKFCSSNHIQLLHSAPFRSRSRGHIEQCNKVLTEGLKYMALETNHTYEINLGIVTYLMNNKKFPHSQLTPTILQQGIEIHGFPDQIFRKEMTEIINKGFGTSVSQIKELTEKLQNQEIEYTLARQNEAKNRALAKNHKRKQHSLNIGDIVVLRRKNPPAQGMPIKLLSNYINIPYKVVKIKDFLIFVQSLDSGVILPRAPGDVKKITGLNTENFKQIGLLSDQDYSKIENLLECITETDMVADLQNLNITDEKHTGVRTRKMTQENELMTDHDLIIKLFLDEDNDDSIDFEG